MHLELWLKFNRQDKKFHFVFYMMNMVQCILYDYVALWIQNMYMHKLHLVIDSESDMVLPENTC